MTKQIGSTLGGLFILLQLMVAITPATAAGKYTLAFWREAGAYENQAPPSGEFGNHSAFVHVWDENGQPVAGREIYTSWGVLLGTTGPDGFTEIELRRPNGYDFQIRDGSNQTDTTPILSEERAPSWGHYSFEIGFMFKQNNSNPGTFDTGALGTINATGTDPCRDLSAPHTRSLAYYSTAATNYCSDAYELGNWTASHGQTFVATGNRIVALKAFMAAGFGVHYYWNVQILEGGPNGPPIGPPRSTRVLIEGEYYPILVKWGINDVQVVPGRTYYFKITRTGSGVNVWRINRNNYPAGNYYENGQSVPGAELMGLVVCGNHQYPGSLGTLTGTVRDTNNVPLYGATVSVPDVALYTTTDPNGAYTLPGVPAGTRAVWASKTGFVTRIEETVTVTVGQTNTLDFQLTALDAIDSGVIITPSYVRQPFETLPEWDATFDASWGSAALFDLVTTGWEGNAMQITRGGPGSSAHVQVFPVTPNTRYEVSVWARCPQLASSFWAECAIKPGRQTAQDFDANPAGWTYVQKFSNNGQNGNGNVWTRYTTTFDSGANSEVSVGFKLGASAGNGPAVQWDELALVSLELPAIQSAVANSPTNLTLRFAVPLAEEAAVDTANYFLSSADDFPQIWSATVVNQTNVILTTDPQTPGVDYRVIVSNLSSAYQPEGLIGFNGEIDVLVPLPLISLDSTTTWRYEDSGANQGGTWRTLTFNDAAWASGPALLGFADAALIEPIRTALTPNPDRVTVYFRRIFQAPPGLSNAVLRLHPIVDDGAVFWLNTKLLLKLGITNSLAFYNTPASRSVGLAGYEGPFEVSSANLVAGDNVLAVEVHQAVAGGADVVFGTALDILVLPSQLPPPPPPAIAFERVDGGLILTWAGPEWNVQQAESLDGPWMTQPDASSPWPVMTGDGNLFFRLIRSNP